MKFNFKLKNKIEEGMVIVQEKSWVITVFIFLIVLVSAVIIWNDCILAPRSSESALLNIENTEKDYQRKMKEIKKNNQELEKKIERFNNPISNLKEGRKYFKPSDANILIPLKNEDDFEEKNFNSDLIN